MLWILLAFLSAALLGLYDVAKKRSLTGNSTLTVLLLNIVICCALFIPRIIGSAVGMIDNGSTWYIPVPDVHAHLLIALKSLIVLASWILGFASIKHLPITLVGPINATRPVMVLIGAVLVMGEHLTLLQWAGVSLAIIALLLLSRSSRKEGIHFLDNRYVPLLFAACAIGACSALYDKYLFLPVEKGGAGLEGGMVQGWFYIYQSLEMFIVWLLLHKRSSHSFQWRWSIPLISLFIIIADAVYYHAMSIDGAMISIVSMIRRGSVLVSFTCGALIFGERNLKSKALDLLLVLISMVLLALGTK